jgi:response regulator RpfG family c-di-GMP phosphodiesterase
MTLCGRNVLLVGQNFHSARALTDKLHRWKFQNHFASNIRAASDLLGSNRVDLVLSHTNLSDGTGLGLLAALAHFPVVTAFLCLPVENSCHWLPAIDGGKKCLGLPALRPLEFARALEEMARCLSTRIQAACPRLDDLIAVDRDCA